MWKHYEKIDEFIRVMKGILCELVERAQTTNTHVFGFAGLKAEDLNLDILTVELA